MEEDGDHGDQDGRDFEEKLVEAMDKVCLSGSREDIDPHDAGVGLLELVVEHGDAAQRQEAVEHISQHTGYNKSTAKEWVDEVESDVTLGYIDVNKVVQIKPYDPDEPDVWEFHVTARGEDVTFRIDTNDLMGPRSFQERVFEATHVKVKFDDWDEMLNEWMDDADIVERKAEPIQIEHQIARRVIENIGSAGATMNYDEFRDGSESIYLEDGEVWVRSELVNNAMSSANQEISRRRLREILSDVMVGNSKRIRSEDEYITVWRFDAEKLDSTSAVDVDVLADRISGTDDTDDGDGEHGEQGAF